jgi:hypothetical protein
MATLSQVNVQQTESQMTLEQAAAELYKIVESHFDDLGLAEAQRDERYNSLRESLDAKDAASAKV